MSAVGFVVHEAPAAVEAADASCERSVQAQGVDDRRCSPGDGSLPARRGLDLVVSVGGDGTFLRAAYAAVGLGCPVLGVKVGRLGFLTEVEPAEAARR